MASSTASTVWEAMHLCFRSWVSVGALKGATHERFPAGWTEAAVDLPAWWDVVTASVSNEEKLVQPVRVGDQGSAFGCLAEFAKLLSAARYPPLAMYKLRNVTHFSLEI